MDGDKLYKILHDNGLTQCKFAELIGVPDSYVSNLVNNKVNPTAKTIKKICEVLNVTPNDIM